MDFATPMTSLAGSVKPYVPAFTQFAGAVGTTISGFRAANAAEATTDAEIQARLARGKIDAEQSRKNARYLLSKQRATVGAAGLAPSGSPLAFMLDSAMQAELERRLIRTGARTDAGAIGYRGSLAAKRLRSEAAGGLATIGGLFQKHASILQELYNKAKGLIP